MEVEESLFLIKQNKPKQNKILGNGGRGDG